MLREIYPTLPAMRNEAKINKSELPYIYRMYNVKIYFCSSSAPENGMVRLMNSLLKLSTEMGVNYHV